MLVVASPLRYSLRCSGPARAGQQRADLRQEAASWQQVPGMPTPPCLRAPALPGCVTQTTAEQDPPMPTLPCLKCHSAPAPPPNPPTPPPPTPPSAPAGAPLLAALAAQRLPGGGRPVQNRGEHAAQRSAAAPIRMSARCCRADCLLHARAGGIRGRRSPVACPFRSCSVCRTDLPQVTDEALAALGCPAHLTCLRLDYCVDVTDAGLALLQGERRKLPDVAAAVWNVGSPAALPFVVLRPLGRCLQACCHLWLRLQACPPCKSCRWPAASS